MEDFVTCRACYMGLSLVILCFHRYNKPHKPLFSIILQLVLSIVYEFVIFIQILLNSLFTCTFYHFFFVGHYISKMSKKTVLYYTIFPVLAKHLFVTKLPEIGMPTFKGQ